MSEMKQKSIDNLSSTIGAITSKPKTSAITALVAGSVLDLPYVDMLLPAAVAGLTEFLKVIGEAP